jgi:hypothetical protein
MQLCKQHAAPVTRATVRVQPQLAHPFTAAARSGPTRRVHMKAQVDTSSSASPARQAISGLVSGIYKATAAFQAVEPGTSPLWAAVQKLDLSGEDMASVCFTGCRVLLPPPPCSSCSR